MYVVGLRKKQFLLYQVGLYEFDKMVYTTIKQFSQIVVGPSGSSSVVF